MPYKEGEFTIGSASIVADGNGKPIRSPLKLTREVRYLKHKISTGPTKAEPKAERANGNVFIKLFVDCRHQKANKLW